MQDISWFIFFMILMTFILDTFIYCIGTSDVSNPTPVYVVEGGEAVLQCEFGSSKLTWQVYSDITEVGGDVCIGCAVLSIVGAWVNIADGGDINGSKYSTSKIPSTELYYKLHILNVGVSDVKKNRCEAVVNGRIQLFYLKLDLIGRCIK